MKKKSKLTQIMLLIAGSILMFLSYLIYNNKITSTFLSSVNSDIFGAGLVFAIIGLIWLIFKIRLD